MTTQTAEPLYGEVNRLEDVREINRKIRAAMGRIRGQEELTELKKRSDYLCTLTRSPAWRTKFGRRISRYLAVAREEDWRTTEKANKVARQKDYDVEYHAWGSGD